MLLLANLPLFSQSLDAGGAAASVQPSIAEPQSTPSRKAMSASSEGLLFSSPDGSDTLRVHGYLQADDRMFSSNTQGRDFDTFLFRRIRPLFEGTLFNAFDYRFMPDFGQYNPQIQEAYIEWKTLGFAKLRVGKFKEPVGLEALRSDRELTFGERSMASDLVPLRYMGAQVGGSVLSNSVEYSVGYFNGSNDGSNGNFQWVQSNEFAGRVFLRPFAATSIRQLRDFGFGLAGSSGAQHGKIAGLKTEGQSTFFKYSSTAVANGPHTRVAPQAYYFAGPAGVMAEYVISSQSVLNKTISRELTNQAWELTSSVVLTGEKNSYSGVRPRNSFEPARGIRHLGAVELAARYSKVAIDRGTFPLFAKSTTAAEEAREYGIGVNWYLNRFTKLTTDYEHTNFTMAKRGSGLHDENVLMSRVQLAF
jgi:phosphate-selective porin OprO/OprP